MGKRRLARVRSGQYDVESLAPVVASEPVSSLADVAEGSDCPFDGKPCAHVDCCDAIIGFDCDFPHSQ